MYELMRVDRVLVLQSILFFQIVFKEVWMGGLLFGWFPVFSQRKIQKTHATGKFRQRKHQLRLGYINFSGKVDQNSLGVQNLTVGESKSCFPSFPSKSSRSLSSVPSQSRGEWSVNKQTVAYVGSKIAASFRSENPPPSSQTTVSYIIFQTWTPPFLFLFS